MTIVEQLATADSSTLTDNLKSARRRIAGSVAEQPVAWSEPPYTAASLRSEHDA
jgi:hypothetical protein